MLIKWIFVTVYSLACSFILFENVCHYSSSNNNKTVIAFHNNTNHKTKWTKCRATIPRTINKYECSKRQHYFDKCAYPSALEHEMVDSIFIFYHFFFCHRLVLCRSLIMLWMSQFWNVWTWTILKCIKWWKHNWDTKTPSMGEYEALWTMNIDHVCSDIFVEFLSN